MATDINEYLAMAVNMAAAKTGPTRSAWSCAIDTAQRRVNLKFALTAEPSHWKQVDSPDWSITLLACNDALATADVLVSDGTNTVTVAVARPMWTYGAGAVVAVTRPGEFISRLREELGFTDIQSVSPLRVDPNDSVLKFTAARSSIGSDIRSMDETIPMCSVFQSANAELPGAAIVRVDQDGCSSHCVADKFPKEAMTTKVISELINHSSTNHTEVAGLVASRFQCLDGDVLLLCVDTSV